MKIIITEKQLALLRLINENEDKINEFKNGLNLINNELNKIYNKITFISISDLISGEVSKDYISNFGKVLEDLDDKNYQLGSSAYKYIEQFDDDTYHNEWLELDDIQTKNDKKITKLSYLITHIEDIINIKLVGESGDLFSDIQNIEIS